MTDEPTHPVEMTLNENGMLCHLLLPEIVRVRKSIERNSMSWSAFDTPKIRKANLAQMIALYDKLSAANDKLMGKT